MRKLSVVFFVFAVILGYAQSVNLYNPATNVAYPANFYFCPTETFNLKVDAVQTSTGDYAMTKDLPSNFPLSAGSLPINFSPTGFNKFSDAIPIGFNFSFYGKVYTKVVAGSNGRLVFTNSPEIDNLKNNSIYTDRTFSGIPGYNSHSVLPSKDYNKVYVNNPSQELNLAQIFFGYTDLVPRSQNSSVTYLYKNITAGGVNGLLISYQNMIRTNGTGGFSSSAYYSNIILFEDGRIVIYVNAKTEDTYNAILGIQNDDASKFRVPQHSNNAYDYNNGKWKSEGVAWVFTPNQNLTPQFKWYKNTTLLAETSNTLTNFSPADGDIAKVEVTYHDSTGAQVGSAVSDQVTFKAVPKFVINYNSSAACVTGVTMTVPSDPDLDYQWFRVGSTTVLGTGNTYYATQNGDYFVRVTRKILPTCFQDSNPVTVNLNSTIPAFNANNKPFNYCDTTGAATKTINLYDYYPPDPSKYTLNFTENGATIPDPANFVISANTVRTIHIDVNDPASGCTINQNFDIRFDSLPAAVNNLQKKYCYGQSSVDVSQFLPDLAGANYAVYDYLYSTDNVNFTTTSVINPKQFPKVWVKILPKNQPASNCVTTSSIVFSEALKVTANIPDPNNPDFQQCASATQYFALSNLFSEINPDPNVTITFHLSLNEAENGANPVPYNFRSGMGETILYIRVVDTISGCISPDHPTVKLLVYHKPTLLKNSISMANCQGNSIFDLTQSAASLVNADPRIQVKLEYYSQAGTLLTGNQITNYNETANGAHPYIKVIYNPTCNDTVTFDLTYNAKPTAQISQILVCSETTYSLNDFKNKVISNSANYTFTDLAGNPLPANFNLSVLPLSVNFLMKDNTTGCISNPETVTFVRGGNSALNDTETDYVLCDTDFDGKTTFDLDSKKTDFTSNTNAVFDYFKDAGFTQSIGASYLNEVAFNQTVYAKVTLPGFCPAVAKINLKVNTPTRSTKLQDKYFICYGETLPIDGGPENSKWEWSTGESQRTIRIKTAGAYSVKLTNANGCSYTHNFIVSDENQPKIEVINQTNNSIEVIANGGVKPYKYWFNGVAQNSNILSNPTAAFYTIQVESATGCMGEPKTIYFIKINNAFTPNADGINDYWTIENLDKMDEISLVIVDRYGNKVFESQNKNSLIWDGKMNGRSLPTGTYWYTVTWYDAVTAKNEQRQGWILLKNRN